MIYGFALCAPLGTLTVSVGAQAASRGMISDLQSIVAGFAIGCAALLWGYGAWWGWRSFEELQMRYNVGKERS